MGFTNALWRQIDHLRWWMILVLAIGIRLTFVYYLYFIYITPGGGRLSLGGLSDTTYHYGALQLLQGSIATGYFAYHAPLMAMLIAVVYALFGVDAIYLVVVVQAIFSAATCLFAWSAAKTLGLDDRLGKTAALLLALDLSSIGVSLVIGAEVVSNFFIAWMLLFLARLLLRGQLRDALACGAALVLAALARPNAVYFAAPAALAILLLSPRRWVNAALFGVICVLGMLPWFFRNYVYHRAFTFSTVGNFNLLFYRAASVEFWATASPVEEIQSRLAFELDRRLDLVKKDEVYNASSIWRHLALDDDPRADRVMRDMALEIFLAHPKDLAISLSVALVKVLSYSEAFNPIPVFKWLNVLWNGILYLLAIMGGVFMLLKRQWIWLAVTALPIAYFIAVPTIAGGIQDTRSATSVTICFVLMAVYGIVEVKTRRVL